MPLAFKDLDLTTDIQAEARRIADDLDMSEDVLIDHVLETYAPEDRGQGDSERFQAVIRAMIEDLKSS